MATLPGPPVPQAILFATDSRLTELSRNRTLDIGEKLYPVCGNAGLVFSGNFQIGRKCVQELQSILEEKQTISAREIVSMTQTTFKQEFYQFARIFPNRHLSLMLGVYDYENSQVRLVGYESPYFQPMEMKGVNAIGGTPEIQELYKEKFEDFVKKRYSHGGGITDNPLEWLNFIQIVLNNAVIESKLDPRIGGLVQTAIIDRNGFNWVGHSVRKPIGKWISTEWKNGSWHMVEVDSQGEIARTVKEPEGFFKISD
jgi:hypothetical protein